VCLDPFPCDVRAPAAKGFSPELPRATWSRPNLETLNIFFKNLSCGRESWPNALRLTECGQNRQIRTRTSDVKFDLRRPQVGIKLEKKGIKTANKPF